MTKKRQKKAKPVKILMDSSFLLDCILDKESRATAISKYFLSYKNNTKVYVPLIVIAETIHQLKRKMKVPLESVLARFERFNKEMHFLSQYAITLKEYYKTLRKFSHRKIILLKANDFIVAAEGVRLKAMILTGDHDMYEYTHPSYKKIYFVKTESKYSSKHVTFIRDFDRLIKK